MNPAGLIITNGLGGSASSLITATYGLNPNYNIVIIVDPPQYGGGGGGMAHLGGAISMRHDEEPYNTRKIYVTVNMSNKSWRKTYTVSNTRANIVVKIVNFTNTIKQRFSVSIDTVKSATKRVTAIFNK